MKRSPLSRWLARWFDAQPLARSRRTALAFDTLEGREVPAAGLQEQAMVEMVNRMRAAPAAERTILLAQPDVQAALAYFNVNQTVLAAQFNALTAQAPLAWSDNLAAAALAHTDKMLEADVQSHQLPGEKPLGERITDAGYVWAGVGENAFTRAKDVAYAHAAFAIDWGIGPNGLQTPAGHRDNLMKADFTDIGIGLRATTPGKKSGPLLVTQNFGKPQTAGNPYLLGVVYSDANANARYDLGEGLSGVTVTLTPTGGGAAITLTTTAAGYYQSQVAAGDYAINVTGGALPAPLTRTVTVAAVNVKSDFIAANAAVPARVDAPTTASPKEDVGTLQIKITRSGDLTSAFDVPFTVTPGSAATPADYTVVTPSPLAFAANETEKTIEVTIVARPGVFTGPKTFALALGTPTGGAAVLNGATAVTIVDNDAPPSYALSLVNAPGLQIAENAGPLRVKITHGAGGVTVATVAGTAVAGTDYTAVDQALTFNAVGETIVEVPILDNTRVDGNRTFDVKLSNPVGGALTPPSVLTVTIVDDDVPPVNAGTVSLSGPTEILKTSAGATITITRTTAGATASVRVRNIGGTAIAGTDFTGIDQVVSFGAADTSKTVTLVPTGASVGDKTVIVGLSDFANVAAGTPTQFVVTITDPPANPGAAPTGVVDRFVVRRGDASSAIPSVLANDTNAPTAAALVKNPTAGAVVLNADGTFTYTPGAAFPGVDSFTYRPSNAAGDGAETTVTIMTHEALQIRKLYKQVLNREPDLEGWLAWTKSLQSGVATLGTVASGIFESAERLDPIITKYYRDYLSRDPDAAGLAAWRAKWQADGGPENVVAGLISSAEYYQKAGGTNAGWITGLYRSLLGREPEAEGLNAWLNLLNTGGTRERIVAGFINSEENRQLLVNAWFQQYLNRAPSAAEREFYVARLRAGATQRSIQITLIDTAEYLNSPPPPAIGTGARVQ